MKLLFTLLLVSCGLLVSAQEDEMPSFGVRGGYVLSNALVPNGNLVYYNEDGIPREQHDSFDFLSGYQFGVSFKYPLETITLEAVASYAKNGFANEGQNFYLDYLSLDTNVLTYIEDSPAFVGGGLGYAYLVNHKNLVVTNTYDIRLNAVIGVSVADQFNIFFQGKYGLIHVENTSELNTFNVSLNLEYLFF
jgi:hypothetical protein